MGILGRTLFRPLSVSVLLCLYNNSYILSFLKKKKAIAFIYFIFVAVRASSSCGEWGSTPFPYEEPVSCVGRLIL